MKFFLKIVFITYWAITLLYVSPDNFVKVKADNVLQVFSVLFEQKWSFFAPPPQGNHRLYYTFYDDNKQAVATFEAIKPLLNEKQRKKPWNTREEAIDYIVNGSIANVIEFVVTQREIYQSLYPDSTFNVVEQKARLAISEKYNEISAFATLVEYGKIVANKNLAPEQYGNVNSQLITITEERLPKFVDRSHLANDSTLVEGILLETPLIPINISHNGIN